MKKYIKRFLFSLVITLSFCFVDTCLVNATSYNIIQKQGYYSTLGGKYFANINSYITIPRYSNNNLTMDFTFDISSFFQTIPDNTLTSEFDTLVNSNFATGYVVLDYCSTYGQLIDDVYSSYNNYMDLIHYVGTCQATTSNRGSAYRIYMRISPPSYTYTSSNSSTYLGYYNSVLHYTNNSEYDLVIRPLNLILYDSDNYYSLLDKARESAKNQTQIEQNQQIINKQEQTNQNLDNINGSINNSNVDDPSSSINSFQNMLATNGVITQLVTLPVTLFTKVLNSVNGSCSNYNLGSLLGTDLILPCINIQNYLGNTLWSVIDVLISGLFVYAISRKFIKVFENLSSMKDGDVISD